ncbi:MAG: acetate--CoA ligase family protein [Chloroflexi bacterium]|nr:acetate--CoA ligase family protein [Chloroflexota bacterium]
MTLHHLFYPRGVALIGSVAEGKIGYELLRQMRAGGYRDLYAVNPKAQGALDVPGYASVAAVGRPVDLAVIVSPAATVAAVLDECGQAGVKAAVVISSGFSEMGNRAGEAEMVAVAARHGIRIVGPNCAGIINTANRLCPTMETLPPPGHVALISQSGALAGVVLGWAARDGLGISKFVSYGNRADINEIHLLEYLAEDAETQVVGVYIETVSDGRAFMAAVARCAAVKPVIVIKAGRGESGQRATLSHTGSLAGSDAAYNAALRQCGAIRVTSAEEMFDLCRGFVGLPAVCGRRVAIVTNSGGPSILAADRAEEVGLQVAEPGPEIRARLAAFLPPHAALKNPIDLTVEGTERGYREALTALLTKTEVKVEAEVEAKADLDLSLDLSLNLGGPFDAVVAINIAPPYLDSVPIARGICDAAVRSGKPVVASFLPERVTADAVAYLQAHGVLNFPTPERAVAVLARMAECKSTNQRISESANHSPFVDSPFVDSPFAHSPFVLEPDAMAWLRENGIPTPEFRFAADAETAVQGCRELGYPVVMKVVSPDILHKSERGGVKLNIADDAGARAAFDAIGQAAAGADFRGVVIYPMVRGAQEVLVGLSRDPQFGPVLAFGLGGIYTEVLRDVALRVAPIDRAEAGAMIRSLRAFPILAGVRGQPPRDLDALADLLVQCSQLPFRYPEIAELDLNPVFLLERGLVVGDVRVISAK